MSDDPERVRKIGWSRLPTRNKKGIPGKPVLILADWSGVQWLQKAPLLAASPAR